MTNVSVMLYSELYLTRPIHFPKRERHFQHTNMSIYTSPQYVLIKLCLGAIQSAIIYYMLIVFDRNNALLHNVYANTICYSFLRMHIVHVFHNLVSLVY